MTEAEIRDAIVNKLTARSPGRPSAFIAEMHVDGFARRADLVVAGATLAAFEIKTGRDTLVRLPGQLQSYQRFFEQVTVVCAEKHVDGVMALADETVGVWRVTADGRLRVMRGARRSAIADKSTWLSFLPVAALRTMCRSAQVPATGSRPEVLERMQRLSLSTIRRGALDHLRHRVPRGVDAGSPRAVDPVSARDAEVRRFLERLNAGRPLPSTAGGHADTEPDRRVLEAVESSRL